MIHKRSVVAGLLFGGLIVAFGLLLIFAKDLVWSWFEFFYSMLGIQAERSRFWGMFISTIGLAIFGLGAFLMFTVWKRWRIDRS